MTKRKAEEDKEQQGRPTMYRTEYAEQARKLCLLGATDKDLASFFGIQESTLYNWKLKHPKFVEAIKSGKDTADSNVASRLYERALGFEHASEEIKIVKGKVTRVPVVKIYPPDPVSAIFWLKNRQKDRWRDKQDHEHTGKDGGPILVSVKDFTGRKKEDGQD